MSRQDVPPDAALLVACRTVGRAMDLFDDAACAALGIGRSDLRALNLLEHGPLSAAVLADRLALSRASVTSLVDRLEAAGYVSRTPDPVDRRAVRIALLPMTWQAFARVYRPLGQTVHASLAHLEDRDRDLVAAALLDMAAAFDASRAVIPR